jgi:hypothetical protein
LRQPCFPTPPLRLLIPLAPASGRANFARPAAGSTARRRLNFVRLPIAWVNRNQPLFPLAGPRGARRASRREIPGPNLRASRSHEFSPLWNRIFFSAQNETQPFFIPPAHILSLTDKYVKYILLFFLALCYNHLSQLKREAGLCNGKNR